MRLCGKTEKKRTYLFDEDDDAGFKFRLGGGGGGGGEGKSGVLVGGGVPKVRRSVPALLISFSVSKSIAGLVEGGGGLRRKGVENARGVLPSRRGAV